MRTFPKDDSGPFDARRDCPHGGVARGLCLTPPMLVSDGCVFNVNGI